MRRLIQSEFKKIFKSKINIVLLLILFIFNGYRTYQVYHQPLQYRTDIVMKDENGMLPDEASPADGMHFGPDYYTKWFEYLKTHTVEQA